MLATTCGKLGFPFWNFRMGKKYRHWVIRHLLHVNHSQNFDTPQGYNFIMFSKINPFKIILNQSLSRHTLCWHCHSLDLNSTCRCAYNKLKHQPANHLLTKKSKHVLPHPKKNFMSSRKVHFWLPRYFPIQTFFKRTMPMFQTPGHPTHIQGSQWRKAVSQPNPTSG